LHGLWCPNAVTTDQQVAGAASGVFYAVIHLLNYGYLPQPFFYDPSDTWMDWFNVADWAYDKGTYDSWGSIYPPLSFVFMRLVSLPYCYIGGSGGGATSHYARDCDWLGLVMVHGFYVIDIILVAVVLTKIDRRTALARSVALAMGLPLTSGLERGQILLVTFTCVILAFGPLLKSARLRWIALGCALNFKIFLITLIFPQLLKRRWRWFEGAAIATVLIYLVTYGLLGRGSPIEVAMNAVGFKAGATTPLDAWIASTYNPILSLADSVEYQAISTIGSREVDLAVLTITLVLRSTQAISLLAFVATWLRPEAVSINRVTLLAALFGIITVDSQYYSVCIVTFLMFMEPWRGGWIKVATILNYLLALPYEYSLDKMPPIVINSYLLGQSVFVEFSIMLGVFVRPGIILLTTFCVAMSIINDVQRQGWRERWRFRRDLPIMVGEGSAYPPGGFKAS
jgi:hypothetical protein